jgi:hypothetical protein
MKRLLLITAILGGAALVPLAAQAQRGGIGMGARVGGVRSGFAARPAGRMVAPVGMVRPTGIRMATPQSRVFIQGQRAFSPRTRFAFRNRFAFNRFHRFRHNRFFFNDCFNTFGAGFGCANPFLFGGFGGFGIGGFGDPFYAPYESEFQQPQQQQQPVVVENEGNDREVAFEIQALREEMQAMRDEERARNEARNNPAPKPSAQQDGPNAVLVFRDGRQLSVRNYAIADHTVWVLGANNARKIPVSDLDVTATEQANANNGVEFRLPH